MKYYLFAITILLTFLSCTKKNNNVPKDLNTRKIEFEQKEDSIRQCKLLDSALFIAKTNIEKEYFYKSYESIPDSNSGIYNINITLGELFSISDKFLLIRRLSTPEAYIDIYNIKDKNFLKVLSYSENIRDYVSDTIEDVNGDGFKDFLIHLYPNSGCCLAETYYVYLNEYKTKSFTTYYEFINPTFYPKEKIIRGIEYGQPGEAELYKYKWSGYKVDTIEFIYPDLSDSTKKSYYKTKKLERVNVEVKRFKLKKVPTEYKTIDNYDWFIGEKYK